MEDLAFELVAAIDFGSVFTKILNVLSVALGLGLVIFFHELGHFAVAKWCDVHVERFSIGIGPILWSRQKGETEYALSALPFGGYVKMLGQDDMDPNQMTSSEIAENPRSYSAKSVPQRMGIISAGVVMNVVTGFLFFTICYWYGVDEPSPVVGGVVPGFPAWIAGMKAGDRIEAINGEEIRSFGDVFESVVLSTGDVRIEGKHEDGSRFDFTLTPDRGASGRSVGLQPTQTTTLSDEILNADDIAIPGLPAKRARLIGETANAGSAVNTAEPVSGNTSQQAGTPVDEDTPFRPGDKLIALQSEPVNSFVDLHRLSAKFAPQELIYTFERTIKSDNAEVPDRTTQVNISVPPDNVRTIGLWMAMGPVRAIRVWLCRGESWLKGRRYYSFDRQHGHGERLRSRPPADIFLGTCGFRGDR